MQKKPCNRTVKNQKSCEKDKKPKNKKHPYDKMTHFEFASSYSAEMFLQLLPIKVRSFDGGRYELLFLEKDMNGRFRIGLQRGGHSGWWYCGELSERQNGCYVNGDIFYNPDENPAYNKAYYKPEKQKNSLGNKISNALTWAFFFVLFLPVLLVSTLIFMIKGIFSGKPVMEREDILVALMTKEMKCELVAADKGEGRKENGGN